MVLSEQLARVAGDQAADRGTCPHDAQGHRSLLGFKLPTWNRRGIPKSSQNLPGGKPAGCAQTQGLLLRNGAEGSFRRPKEARHFFHRLVRRSRLRDLFAETEKCALR